MTQYIVIGTSPFMDESIAVGAFRDLGRAHSAWEEMTLKGWNAETVTLLHLSEVPDVTNDEGAGE